MWFPFPAMNCPAILSRRHSVIFKYPTKSFPEFFSGKTAFTNRG